LSLVTSDFPYAFPAVYHAQSLILEWLLELEANNNIYEKRGGRGKNFFSYPESPDSLASPLPRPFKG